MDLWLDGNLYPINHITKKPPQFQTVKDYLEFLCHGDSSLLGYIKHLVSTSDIVNCKVGTEMHHLRFSFGSRNVSYLALISKNNWNSVG